MLYPYGWDEITPEGFHLMPLNSPCTVAGFDLPPLNPDHKLHRVLASTLGKRQFSQTIEVAVPPWSASFFGLDQISLFHEATAVEQTQMLQRASQNLLIEAYCLEKAGIGYMAKMALLAETLEERMIYALFSADEATHLAQLSAFVTEAEAEQGANDPFLQLWEPLLETADRAVLLFVIQVVLEGWGLSHYRTLSKGCRQSALAELFYGFLQAEVRHHGAGVKLFDPAIMTAANRAAIVEALVAFLQMVRRGPQRLLEAIALVKGDLSRCQRLRLLSELDTETHSGTRLSLLRSLITPIAPTIAEALTARHLFSPLPPSQCL